MYHIFVNDFQSNKQSFVYATSTYLNALEIATNEADEFVYSKMGIKYTGISKKPFSGYGYFYTVSPNKFGKVSVYYKEKNGYVFSGAITKVRSYLIIKVPIINISREDSTMEEHFKMLFNDVLEDLKCTRDEYVLIETYDKVKCRLNVRIILKEDYEVELEKLKLEKIEVQN